MKLNPLVLALALSLAACGDGGGGGSAGGGGSDGSRTLSGGGVKGPLAGAVVRAWQLDASAGDLKGALLGTGSTNAKAAIGGLSLPAGASGPVLVEFVADADTVDLTTGMAPVITRMVTVRDVQDLAAPVYATPLTTLAVDLARRNADTASMGYVGNEDAAISEVELLAALNVAAGQLRSALGFGLLADVDLFSQPPLITDSTDDPADQARVLDYRTAVEAVAAVAKKLQDDARAANADSTATVEDLFLGLAEDLTDGDLDGQGSAGAVTALADLADVATSVSVDPATLVIPNTTLSLAAVKNVLVQEQASTGVATDTSSLDAVTVAPAPAKTEVDSDGDGTADSVDTDNDNDGLADDEERLLGTSTVDGDSDDDGVGDATDAFPLDPGETLDSDGDGTGNNADGDDDNDGTVDAGDAFPLDDSESLDTDSDGTGNNADTDDDNDGVNDGEDTFPLDASESLDTDGDGIGNNADGDDDNDGAPDLSDAFPLNAAEAVDSDGDGVGDNADADDDNDGTPDAGDAFPQDPAEHTDADNDGTGSLADPDDVDSCVPDDTVAACTNAGAVWNSFNWDEANWQ